MAIAQETKGSEMTHMDDYLSREDRDKMQEQIVALTAKVGVYSPGHFSGTQTPLSRSMLNNIKELRRLRRIRDA